MKLVITDWSSADIDNVWDWIPSSSNEICFQLTIEISEKGKKGGNLFQLMVATPEGLAEAARQSPNYQMPDRALLMFCDYKWECVLKKLNDIVSRCTKDDWNESILCLQRYFIWEYEDFEEG